MTGSASEGRGGTLRALALAAPLVVGMAALVTWPQSRFMTTAFASHVDSYFSAWRLMWIAHALQEYPSRLFDANIFYPSTQTLAYSDATMLQGALAAPFLWMQASPILVYNVLLLAGFAGSGLAMFVLARHVTQRTGPALVAAAVFTMAPYRIEHFMHLELQWTMWIPLTFWALHRAIEGPSWRFGALSGLFLWLQMVSCVYYGIFLAVAVAAFAPLLLLRAPGNALRAAPGLALGAALAGVLTVPYALPYLDNTRALGARDLYDVLQFSAAPTDYLAAVHSNWLWGWTSERWGGAERRLFPGLVAVVLAAVAFLRRPRRDAWLYAVMALLTLELSLGLNGYIYSWLFEHVQALRGLRSPARFAIVSQCAIAVLAAIGVRALQDRLASVNPRMAAVVPALALLLATGEYSNRPMELSPVSPPDRSAYDVYRAIRAQGPGVVIELPMPTLTTLPGREAIYAFWSAAHWNKLVNGYSGYYPQVYAETLNRMETFPDEDSIARLRRMDVRYVVVHRAFYREGEYSRLLYRMAAEPALKPFGTYRDPDDVATLFLLLRDGASLPDEGHTPSSSPPAR